MKKIKKILAANRSEIAIRIFRAAEESSIRTVSIYSKEEGSLKLEAYKVKAINKWQTGSVEGIYSKVSIDENQVYIERRYSKKKLQEVGLDWLDWKHKTIIDRNTGRYYRNDYQERPVDDKVLNMTTEQKGYCTVIDPNKKKF